MNSRTKRNLAIAAVLLLLLALTYVVWRGHPSKPAEPAATPPPSAPAKALPPEEPPFIPAPVKPAPKPVVPPAVPKPVIKPVTTKPVLPPPPAKPVASIPTPKPAAPASPVPTSIPKPPEIVLHKELIPKNIEIVRFYYTRDIMGPDTTFGFDINGSGFTNEFQNMIQVDPGGLDIQVQNLRLVTANQIHGEMVVGSDQTTEFLYPKVLIHNTPVFRAPDPFAVVRPSEVLVILFVSLAEDGRSGRFRVITNLDEKTAKQFKLTTSHPGLEISPLEFKLPFIVEGVLQIGASVPQGEYGMSAFIGTREVWKRDKMIRIVRPNIGATGFVQGISAQERFLRPGDSAQLYLHGSGLSAAYTAGLKAHVLETDMGPAEFQYISPAQMRFTFHVPKNAALANYGVAVQDDKNNELFKKNDVFMLVPANWISGVQVAPPLKPGQHGLLRIVGRDFSPDFVTDLQLSVDEPGIELKNLHQIDASNLGADIAVNASVAPGDYWIHLTSHGKEIQPPYGSLIKIEAP